METIPQPFFSTWSRTPTEEEEIRIFIDQMIKDISELKS